jgi:hypothetical protein
MNSRSEVRAAELAATLPPGCPQAELLVLGKAAVDDVDYAVKTGNNDLYNSAVSRYYGIIYQLHGKDSLMGCFGGNPTDGGEMLRDYCRARPGDMPGWYQDGQFVVQLGGEGSIRALVTYGPRYGVYSFEFRAIDCDMPWISDTGFLHEHVEEPPIGRTVDQVALELFRSHPTFKKKKAIQVDSDHWERFQPPDWLNPPAVVPTRKERVAAIAADLPDDRGELLEIAKMMVPELQSAHIENDQVREAEVHDIREAVALKLSPVATAAKPDRQAWSPPVHRTGTQLQLSLFDDPPAAQPEPDPLPAQLEQLHQLVHLAFDRQLQACDASEHTAPRLTRLNFLRWALWPRNNPKDREGLVKLYWEHRLRDLRRCPPAPTQAERSLAS